MFAIFYKRVLIEQDYCISIIISAHDNEFENGKLQTFSESNGIHYNFCSPRIPHQNIVMEKNNKSLQKKNRKKYQDYIQK